MMKHLTTAGLLLGLAAITVMVAWQGAGTVGAALASLGVGVLLLPLAYVPHLVLAAMSWCLLFTAARVPRFGDALYGMWIGSSVDTLLPTANIGGEVVKARAMMETGVPGPDACASVVVDKTVQAISLVFWGLIGIAVLVAIGADAAIVRGALIGSALLSAGIVGFVIVQHAGSFGFLAKSMSRARDGGGWHGLVVSATELDARIRSVYGKPGRIAVSTMIRLLSRIALTAEVWLAANLMGLPISLWEALMLESLTTALRGATFVVPGGWGVQEGGFVVLGGLLGLAPEFMLAVSLATRAREILVSLPGLITWQHLEGRSFWRRALRGRSR